MSDVAIGAAPPANPIDAFLPLVDLAAGDRFPNFILPDQTGAAQSFLDRAKGNVMLILGDCGDPGLHTVERAGLSESGIDCLALTSDSPEAAAKRVERTGLALPLLADSAGKIREALRRMLGFGPRGTFAVLLDRNQRIIEARVDMDGGALVAWAIARARAVPQPEQGMYLRGTAPVLLVPNVLTPEHCRMLIDRWERLGHEEGKVHSIVKGQETSRVHKVLKSRRDHLIMDEGVMKELAALVARRISPELDKAFGFTRFRFDRFTITCYDSERGDYFRRHRDNQTQSTADRRFALTLNLNTEEYEGGGLTFPEYGPHCYSPPTGAAILFSCSLLHEALPVTQGRRFTLLNFLRA